MINGPQEAALFGGSFDPPHLGHRKIIEDLIYELKIPQVIVVPAWLNPFKEHSHASPEQRLEWCRQVFDLPGVVVSDFEIRQGRPVYTVETWTALKRSYPLKYLVIGSDNLPTLREWKDFETLDKEAVWIVATRAGNTPDLSFLRRAILLPVEVPVSSTRIRRGEGLEYVDPRIREEVIQTYQLKKERM
ncbi:nicotinate (nicotinamide) nucleotide adenylyltransferase [Nitratifractor salsuginis]|uniref:Probable nicotinate-nucleotide adenylyltransferase n=1 Tax=Nitratifractor salsuginis (strain DSM 16511 / JCM 12458 / E9I37-1) TaxID=749222 RepID=E6WZ08_NITSE|nr:nicotinate (nicotinamide) nucleotide adenylyltransferase [Nitratifractor salsuginis]ADV45458.1 nicotinate (nicotinamide) nucleotide adenylyltransferase [Nitratifractor salsuginis DSM 16511]